MMTTQTVTPTVEEVTVTIAGDVWSDWQSPIDAGPGSTDTRASLDAFCVIVEREIEASFPGAVVTVNAGYDEIDDAIQVYTDDDADPEAASESAEMIVAQIIDITWQHSDDWVVAVPEMQA